MQFLLESLRDLDASLRRLDSRLIVLQGCPVDNLSRVMDEWSISRLAFEVEHDPYGLERDGKVRAAADSAGVEVVTRVGHTLVDPEAIQLLSGGKWITQYDAFCKLLGKELDARPISIAETPSSLPPLGPVTRYESFCRGKKEETESYPIPTLEQTGLTPMSDACVLVRGGESVALEAMATYLANKQWVAEFEKPSTSPTEMRAEGAFGPNTGRSTTILSPYLHFGCLSSRRFYEELSGVYASFKKHAQPPVSLHGQLLWRDFYYSAMYATPNYHRMVGNPICRQIPWKDDAKLLAAWKNARTGYPWIDAAMTQLRREGWIHHLARHAVACFLTRGDFYQSWERGAEVFDGFLIDADPALNPGNWMWLSCSCFFYQYFRCYSPVAFPKKYDKEGAYVRHWLPQLAKFPTKYIYEPWKAPIAEQKKAGCIIGKDYPKPVVLHEVASKENMDKMHKAYDEHKKAAASGGASSSSHAAKAPASSASKRKGSGGGKQSKLTRTG
jgi:cryptochrome